VFRTTTTSAAAAAAAATSSSWSGWCVPIWQLFLERKEQEQQDEKGAKIIIFYGFQKLL